MATGTMATGTVKQLTADRALWAHLKARSPLLWVVTKEERRVERRIASIAKDLKRRPIYWDCATGARDTSGTQIDIGPEFGIPGVVFDRILKREEKEVWILRDLEPLLRDDPYTVRQLKSLAREIEEDMTMDSERKELTRTGAVVVVGNTATVPDELRETAVVIDWPLPSREEIREILVASCRVTGKKIDGDEEAAVDAATGLTAADCQTATLVSVVEHGAILPGEIAQQKKMIIDREKTLTWEEPDPRGLDAIGGLDLLKDWLSNRRSAVDPAAQEFGIDPPRGVLIGGIPGCGKSLTAKSMAAAWGLPLLRLDIGALKDKWVGSTEANIRQAQKTAEAVAPVVVWLDEIDKSLGDDHGLGHGGETDILGSMLTWMEERQGTVFVAATANNASRLPPEMLRPGRFDSVFFVDLPTLPERREILEVTLRLKHRDPDAFDLDEVARATRLFTGAELAKGLVGDALLAAWNDGRREPTTEDLLTAASGITPQAQSNSRQLKQYREWAKVWARHASSQHRAEDGDDAAEQVGTFHKAVDLTE